MREKYKEKLRLLVISHANEIQRIQMDGFFAWDYLMKNTLYTMDNEDFFEIVRDVFFDLYNEPEDILPTVSDIADAIDDINIIIIQEFYQQNDFQEGDINILVGNYLQEYSCMMEDWVQDALDEMGFRYRNCSVSNMKRIEKQFGGQNILFPEFVR